MKRLLSGMLACLLIFSACFSAFGEDDDELSGLDELTRKEVKAVNQWYQKALKKKITAGKGQPFWAGKAVFACWYEPFDRFMLSSESVRDNKNFYGLSSYEKILAKSLEDADLLVIIDRKLTKTGTYTDRSFAYKTDTLAYVIELYEKRLYGPYTMASNDPPAVIREKWASHSGEFEPENAIKELAEKWVETPPEEKSEEAYLAAQELEKAGNYYQAREKYMESLWKDWRKKVTACQKSMPKTGVLWRNKNVKGNQATLTLQVKGAPKNSGFLARIYQDGTAAAYVFIRGNGKASVKLPAGDYTVDVGAGLKWFGEKDAFGDDYEGDYYSCRFADGAKTLTLGAKKTVTVEMTVYASDLGIDIEGEYWEKKGKKADVETELLKWKDFRR